MKHRYHVGMTVLPGIVPVHLHQIGFNVIVPLVSSNPSIVLHLSYLTKADGIMSFISFALCSANCLRSACIVPSFVILRQLSLQVHLEFRKLQKSSTSSVHCE